MGYIFLGVQPLFLGEQNFEILVVQDGQDNLGVVLSP